MRLIKVGRDQSCDLRLNSPKVSSLHAEITILNNGDMLLEDKGSTNGTYIMNRPIKPGTQVPISRGDAVRFGDTELVWSMIPPMEDLSRYKGIYGIGKHSLNEIRLDGATVSRFHATLKKEKDDKVYIEDHSKNGTTVNGEKLAFGQRRRLKRGDAVVCGGVTVPESYLKSIVPNFVWPTIVAALGGVAAVVAIVFFILPYIIEKTYEDEELHAMYNKSVAMVEMRYHYHVTAGNFDLSKIGLKTDIVLNERIENWNGNNSMLGHGTAFWISEDGLLMTNLHMLKPWLFGDEKKVTTEITDVYKEVMATYASVYPELNAYTSQIRIEGVLDFWGVHPDGKHLSSQNLIECKEILVKDDSSVDLALMQSVNCELPKSATCLDMDKLVLNNADMKVGSHVYTMGYPMGLSSQIAPDEGKLHKLELYARGGSITRLGDEYRFGFDAASFGGASGSPVFNNKGFLVGVLDSGFSNTQGFNYAMKAKHVKSMLDDYYKKKR